MQRALVVTSVLACLSLASPSRAAFVYFGGNETVEGNINNGSPFSAGSGFGSPATIRYQQVYGSSGFGTTPILLTGIAFRWDIADARNTGTPGPDGTIYTATSRFSLTLSTTSKTPDGGANPLAATFANNTGLTPTTVIDDDVTFSTYVNGGSKPNPFIELTFATPYVYTPALGNLLVDVREFGLTSTYPNYLPSFDASSLGTDLTSRTSANDVNATSATLVDGYGLVTRFNAGVVPEPTSLAAIAIGAVTVVRRRRTA